MENNELSDVELAMRYPPSIIDWEMKHGIVRYEKNGMTYVCCARPFKEVCESINKEEAEIKARIAKRERRMMP